jgi:hypothetical protein
VLTALAFESMRSQLEVKKRNVSQVTRKMLAVSVPMVFPWQFVHWVWWCIVPRICQRIGMHEYAQDEMCWYALPKCIWLYYHAMTFWNFNTFWFVSLNTRRYQPQTFSGSCLNCPIHISWFFKGKIESEGPVVKKGKVGCIDIWLDHVPIRKIHLSSVAMMRRTYL